MSDWLCPYCGAGNTVTDVLDDGESVEVFCETCRETVVVTASWSVRYLAEKARTK